MPVTDNCAGLGNRRRASHSDQYHRDRHHRNRRSRVHRNAQRAMVRIALQRMHVRHLGHGQQRQQGQAQKSGCPESTRLPAAIPAKICL
jgi:hypothetical protein